MTDNNERSALPARRDQSPVWEPASRRQLSIWTAAGQEDRRREGEHVVRMRQLYRGAIEAAAEQAAQTVESLARLERRSRVLTEAKYAIHRAHKESQILGGDDPVLSAKFAILDDDLFSQIRLDSPGDSR